MFRALIFDLDWCIVDNRTITDDVMSPVFLTVERSSLSNERKREIIQALEMNSLADVVGRFEVPIAVANTMDRAYRALDVPDTIRTFGDEKMIALMPGYKVLVTSGYQKFQRGKIRKLGLESLFDEIIIDALDGEGSRRGKQNIFQTLLGQHGWQPREVCVVGDNPDSELKAAKELGMIGVQILRPSITKAAGIDHYVQDLCELARIVM